MIPEPVAHHPIRCPACKRETDADPRQSPQVVHCTWCGTDWIERTA